MPQFKTSVVIVAAFVVTLVAGAGGGIVMSRHAWLSYTPAQATTAGQASLAEDLQLSPLQRKEMRGIWEDARDRAKAFQDDVKALQKGRDDDLVALLDREQRAKFEKIARDYADRLSAVLRQRETMYADAVQRTRTILTPVQCQRYEQLLHNRFNSPTPTARGISDSGEPSTK